MNKTVLITGASSGIGKATAKLLLAKGFNVYGAARTIENMKELKSSGLKILSMDLSDEDSIFAGYEKVIENEGSIDILVNNAGYGSYGALEDVTMKEAKYQFEVNLFGLARLIQLFLPTMRKKRSGKIINISSIGGEAGEPHGAWYHASKFALEGLSDSLRMELKQFGIDVVVIQPGGIKTEWNRIARENLITTSGNTAYGELAQKHAKFLEVAGDGKLASNPIVIAKAIEKVILSKNPKPRIAVGGGAKIFKIIRAILSDKGFDKMMLSQINKTKIDTA